jgi:uncharacterized protein (TIGR02453 family)
MPDTHPFAGFSRQAVDFYAALEADNTKAFWAEHKHDYEDQVREPMLALLDGLEDEFGPAKLFRPYRDVRFSKDKSPYKTHQGALVGLHPGIGYYVQLSSGGLLAGGGFRMHSPDQVDRFRAAIAADGSGTALERVVDGLRAAGLTVEGDRLKTRPRGYDADHPRIELLKYKELMAVRAFGTPRWLSTPAAAQRVADTWRLIRPLTDWVVEHVDAA